MRERKTEYRFSVLQATGPGNEAIEMMVTVNVISLVGSTDLSQTRDRLQEDVCLMRCKCFHFLTHAVCMYLPPSLYSKEKPLNVTLGIGKFCKLYAAISYLKLYRAVTVKSSCVCIHPGIDKYDSEGRLITAEYDKFFLLTSCK